MKQTPAPHNKSIAHEPHVHRSRIEDVSTMWRRCAVHGEMRLGQSGGEVFGGSTGTTTGGGVCDGVWRGMSTVGYYGLYGVHGRCSSKDRGGGGWRLGDEAGP